MKGQTEETIYAEANNNFLKEVSSFETILVELSILVSDLRTTLNISLNVKSTER